MTRRKWLLTLLAATGLRPKPYDSFERLIAAIDRLILRVRYNSVDTHL